MTETLCAAHHVELMAQSPQIDLTKKKNRIFFLKKKQNCKKSFFINVLTSSQNVLLICAKECVCVFVCMYVFNQGQELALQDCPIKAINTQNNNCLVRKTCFC